MKVLILGASLKSKRYSFIALNDLVDYGHDIVAVGLKEGRLRGVQISKSVSKDEDIHTVTMYLSSKNQEGYYEYLLKLRPQRVIFNPGSENSELEENLKQVGVEVLLACTLILLRTDQF